MAGQWEGILKACSLCLIGAALQATGFCGFLWGLYMTISQFSFSAHTCFPHPSQELFLCKPLVRPHEVFPQGP